MDISVKTLMLRGADLNETTFPHDRTKYLNASENRACIRKVWYSKNCPEMADIRTGGMPVEANTPRSTWSRC